MSQEFECKEDNCNEKVSYIPMVLIGLISSHKTTIPKRTTKHVYLTCEKGHTHKYTVTVEE